MASPKTSLMFFPSLIIYLKYVCIKLSNSNCASSSAF